jgi:hypothetical protein
MKKTIQLTHEKIKYPRMIDAAKSEVRKYVKRERRRELPEGVDFWDFDCKFGDTEADAKVVHLTKLDESISDIETRELKSFYVEILRKEGVRIKQENEKPVVEIVVPKPKGFGE